MKITPVTTQYGTAVKIQLSGNDVATAIDAWLVAQGVTVVGPRTISVNSELCREGRVFVDPSGYVVKKGRKVTA
jgi:hypothetical protein